VNKYTPFNGFKYNSFRADYLMRGWFWMVYHENDYVLDYTGRFCDAEPFIYAVRECRDELVLSKVFGCLDADL